VSLASQLGTSQGQASSVLAQILPELVNQLTPAGQIPENQGDLIPRPLHCCAAGVPDTRTTSGQE